MKKTLTILLCCLIGYAQAQTVNKYVCLGGSFTLSAPDGLSHTWYKGGTIASTDTVYTETSSAAGVFTYTVVSATNGGCTSSPSAPYIVSVLPPINATITSPITTVCSSLGNSLVLTCNAPTGTVLQWSRNGVGIVGATSSTYTVTESVAETVTYSCQVANAALPSCYAVVSKVITVVNAPVAGVIR